MGSKGNIGQQTTESDMGSRGNPGPPEPQATDENQEGQCGYREDCQDVLKDLIGKTSNISWGDIFEQNRHSRCFCDDCSKSNVSTSGKYTPPFGWSRFALKSSKVPAKLAQAWDNYHVAYHACDPDKLSKIFTVGQLAKPGDSVVDPVDGIAKIGINSGHIKKTFWRRNPNLPKRYDEQGKEIPKNEKFDPNQIFMSPVPKYAQYYAKKHEKTIGDFAVQVMLQILIKPKTYTIGPETILAKERFDDLIDNDKLEWYTKGEVKGSLIIAAVLVKIKKKRSSSRGSLGSSTTFNSK
eukprot:m.35315 g.35315  ORF g.35315 m.35315 type:complete len:295 (-) comp8866_c0_seq1:98-982(-)